MSWQERERMGKRRERIAVSVLSLLILFSLLGGYFYLRATQEQVGKLATVSTSEVTISVNEIAPPSGTDAASEPAAADNGAAAAGRGPAIVSEVLSGNDGAPPSASAPRVAAPTPTPGAPQLRTGVVVVTPVRAMPDIGGGGGSGAGGEAPEPAPTRTPRPPEPTAAMTPGAGNPTPVPTSVVTNPTPAPTSTTGEDPTPIGHNSHLHIDGVVGPGAYTTGGIIVSNVGPVAFNYSLSMSTSGSAPFAAALRLRIYLRVGASCNYPGPPPSPAGNFLPLTGDQVGTVLYDGHFGTGNKFGNPSVEFAAGDRLLNIGQSEVLCMEVFFPWPSGNQYQGQAVNGTLIFTAKSPDGS